MRAGNRAAAQLLGKLQDPRSASPAAGEGPARAAPSDPAPAAAAGFCRATSTPAGLELAGNQCAACGGSHIAVQVRCSCSCCCCCCCTHAYRQAWLRRGLLAAEIRCTCRHAAVPAQLGAHIYLASRTRQRQQSPKTTAGNPALEGPPAQGTVHKASLAFTRAAVDTAVQ